MFHERNAVQVETKPVRLWVLQEVAVLLLVLKYPTYNLAPETGVWMEVLQTGRLVFRVMQ